MKLDDLIAKLIEIKNQGYVRSLRRGSTGIGYTFEVLFGIKENNIPIPDIGGRFEIKTVRRDTDSLVTLFTFNRDVWCINQKDFIKNYGYFDGKGRQALKTTLFYGKITPQGLTIDIDKNNHVIRLVDKNSNKTLAMWDIFFIVGKFTMKLGGLLLIIADRRILNDEEYFWYNEAYLLKNPDPRNFLKAFEKSLIGIDIRMHLKPSGSVRNRGTAFRIREEDLIELYSYKKKLI